MSKNILFGVVGLVIVAGAGWYMYSREGSQSAGDVAAQGETSMTTMRELMASGISQKCDFTEPQSGTTGTIYVAGGKVRGDFSSQSAAGAVSGHMIASGETVYTWMDGMSQGFKTSLAQSAQAQGGADSGQGLDPDKKTDYTCTPWAAEAPKFEPPAHITFTDASAMMQGSGAGADAAARADAGGNSAQCAACDMAPEPQRSQCRAALMCK